MAQGRVSEITVHLDSILERRKNPYEYAGDEHKWQFDILNGSRPESDCDLKQQLNMGTLLNILHQ